MVVGESKERSFNSIEVIIAALMVLISLCWKMNERLGNLDRASRKMCWQSFLFFRLNKSEIFDVRITLQQMLNSTRKQVKINLECCFPVSR